MKSANNFKIFSPYSLVFPPVLTVPTPPPDGHQRDTWCTGPQVWSPGLWTPVAEGREAQ